MKELVSTTDWVYLSWAEATLRAQGIPATILDFHTSSVEGSISALPIRLVVSEKHWGQAREILGLGE